MAGITREVWASARYLYAVESLGKERGAGTGFLGVTDGRVAGAGGAFAGFDGSQGVSRRARSIKENGKQAIGKSRGGWNTKINALVAGDRVVAGFSLSPGNAVDAGGGRLLLETVGPREGNCKLLIDRGYEDGQTRLTDWELGYTPVVPTRSNRRHPWEYDRELYKRRNEVERFFRRLKAFRCVATRYEKLDVMFTAFILIAIISISLSNVNTP
jgi:transposase